MRSYWVHIVICAYIMYMHMLHIAIYVCTYVGCMLPVDNFCIYLYNWIQWLLSVSTAQKLQFILATVC